MPMACITIFYPPRIKNDFAVAACDGCEYDTYLPTTVLVVATTS